MEWKLSPGHHCRDARDPPVLAICTDTDSSPGLATEPKSSAPSPGPAHPGSVPGVATRGGRGLCSACSHEAGGPGFQPSRFSRGAATWLRTGLRVGKSPRSGFPDSPRLLCAPCLPQVTPADMFAKAFRVKSNTAIKGPDRRKLRADVAAAFPTLGTDQVSALVPGKEELNVVKLYAHRGDAVTVYVCAGNPILFELEKNLYPTDLMLPGLVVPPAGLPQVQKGDLCAIALKEM
ncbi:uncharacterized protein LOC131814437 isoform X2 [Mustela lutreola]|uniref:uncharacterized protein LOC131814437 isoform X2 n=1 Tax=Mustela lutreola TaxID=9666 RepID=UPI00279786BD|nr:uncharacterized protein LOC131814437 isoform X2 [Mustela lutreola]